MTEPQGRDPGREQPNRGRPSRFVIVVLADDVPDTDAAPTLADAARQADRPDLLEVLEKLGDPPTERQIISVPPAVIRESERVTRRERRRADPSLTKFWRVDVTRRDGDPDEIAVLFEQLPSVRRAYAEIAATEPEPDGVTEPLLAEDADPAAVAMRVSDAAPDGTGVAAVRDLPGGTGCRVGLVDVEQTWRLSHPDLAAWDEPLLAGTNRDPGLPGHHGNAVVGILVATDDAAGLAALAPGIGYLRVASHATEFVNHRVTNAIAAARIVLRRGDVLLLEVTRSDWPTETDYCDFLAIQDAVDAGVVVVEAAGNGGPQEPGDAVAGVGDLDAWVGVDSKTGNPHRMVRDDDRFDSGAIVVGAGRSTRLPDGHQRFPTSNFGERVDCHAWGEDVVTCKADGVQQNFGSTSAATAVVAGLAVLTQSVRLAAGGTPLTSTDMRRVLKEGGTPQSPDPAFAGPMAIGVMPDLAAVAPLVAHAGPVV